ncbi:MAG: divalent metal cation transporter, partial [Planctomycetota bacterium]
TGGSAGSGGIVDSWITIQALIATSFSIAGAFYQAYLVREKGWNKDDVRRGDFDSMLGTAVLIGVTLMIMVTAGTVLHHRISPSELKSAGDVALQLEPLFGPAAKILFCIGILAGAISSFLVNAMLGGTFLADGFGQSPKIDSKWAKASTIGVMFIGMVVALATTPESRVPLIVFAQAMTVLGGPILVVTLIYLAATRLESGERIVPLWMILIDALGAIVILALAIRTLFRILLQLTT